MSDGDALDNSWSNQETRDEFLVKVNRGTARSVLFNMKVRSKAVREEEAGEALSAAGGSRAAGLLNPGGTERKFAVQPCLPTLPGSVREESQGRDLHPSPTQTRLGERVFAGPRDDGNHRTRTVRALRARKTRLTPGFAQKTLGSSRDRDGGGSGALFTTPLRLRIYPAGAFLFSSEPLGGLS